MSGSEELVIPIGKPMRKPRECQQCGLHTGCVYVKTKYGFGRVCVPCAEKMRDLDMLIMPDRILPMQHKEVF